MAKQKRTPAQRDLDCAWCAERASEGLGPAAIVRLCSEPVKPSDFLHISDSKARAQAVREERARRKSVGRLTSSQVSYDLRQVRRRVLAQGDERYRAMLDAAVDELAAVALYDLRAAVDWGPDGVILRCSDELNHAEAAGVASVKMRKRVHVRRDGSEVETVETSIESHGKVAALQALLRHLSPRVTVTLDGPDSEVEGILHGLIDKLRPPPEIDPPGGSEPGEG